MINESVCINASAPPHRAYIRLWLVRRVKILLSPFTDKTHLQAGGGNSSVNAKYEKSLPISVERPNEYSAPILLKHFIESKYSRLDFTGSGAGGGVTASTSPLPSSDSPPPSLPMYYNGLHAGPLEKRNRLDDKWVVRQFAIKGFIQSFFFCLFFF